MQTIIRRIFACAPRMAAIAAFAGAVMFAVPLTTRGAHAKGMSEATSSREKTVEARIANLHSELKITAAQETLWAGVATAMRENAANQEKLIAEKRAEHGEHLTALNDLLLYEKFAQAHVDGLKNLIAAFTTLYQALPDDQKKLADNVFEHFGHDGRRH
ncbi:MAG: Spy/CpxP family protein refolding chaperone [Methylocystis sp.]